MAIFKAKVDSKYTVIPNELLHDGRLSFEAKGLLCLLLSLPEDWKVNKEWIINQSNAGRDKVTRMLRELQDANYVLKVTTHDKSGKITGIDWAVYPYGVSQEMISTVERENRPTDNPDDGKTTTTKERVLQSKDNTNLNDSSDEQSHAKLLTDSFDHFWRAWKECKKNIGKVDTSPRTVNFDKKWKVMFNQAYFKRHSIDEFRKEVNTIVKFCREAHNLPGLNRFENMQMQRFLNEKQWRDNNNG